MKFYHLIDKLNNFTDRIAADKKFPLKIIIIAVAVRLLFTLLHPSVYPVVDMLGYNEAAISLLQDGEYRVKGVISANRPPIYPYFLYVMYGVFGHSFLLVRLVQSIFGALTAWMLFLVGKDMFDRRIGILAGLVYALYPASWAFTDQLLTESLFTLLMLISVHFFMKISEDRNPWVIFGAGFFGGLSVLTRTAFAPYLLFIFAGVFLFKYKSPRLISSFVLAAIISFMVMFPWMLRNQYTHGVFTLNPKSGVDFAEYNISSLPFIIKNHVDDKEILGEGEFWKYDEVTKGKIAMAAAKKWIKKNPHLFIVKGFRQIMNIWGFDRDYFWYYIAGYYGHDPIWMMGILALLMGIPFVIIAPLSTAGFIISKPFRDGRLIPALVIVCLHILTFIVYGFSRHRFPFAAFLIVWAIYALLNWDKVRTTLRRGNKSWKKRAIIFSWCFIAFAWSLEIVIDLGQLLNLHFIE